jgi:two-component system, LytTR family, response regulator
MIKQNTTTQQLIVRLSEGVFYIDVQNIIRLEALSNYTRIYFSNRSPLLSACVLKMYDEQLQSCGFIRLHRSHLVNRQHISSISKNGIVNLSEGSRIFLSRRKKPDVMKVLTAS